MKTMVLCLLILSGLGATMNDFNEDTVICSFPKKELITFITKGFYHPSSLDNEGFIHCCRPSQLRHVADKYFHEDEQVLLVSTKERLGGSLIYEGERSYPHLYRELLNTDLTEVFFMNRDKDGQFSIPKELRI